ncbi:MAG: immune inhibitor A [Chloroflexi bacterium]|nr:immune inhibitor A [Chloroflexota bacterium]
MNKSRGGKILSMAMVLIMLVLGVGGTAVSGASTYAFNDDVENAASNLWVADAPWERTNASARSGSWSWTDSPGGYYANNADVSLTLASPVDLSTAVKPTLKFWQRYQFDPGFDFGYVEASTDGGATWPDRLATYTGTNTGTNPTNPWEKVQIDLTPYASQSNVKIRFRLVSDASRAMDGWYLDEIGIAELPLAVTLNAVTNPTRSTLDLSWTQSTDPDFARYIIRRSLAPGAGFTTIAMVSDVAATTYTDTNLAAKTKYYYIIVTDNTYGVGSDSNGVVGTTLVGLQYPFFDNMEAGGNNWIPNPAGTWTLVTPDVAHSGNKVWTDSPQGGYADNANATLTLADDLEVNPLSQLVFWQRLNIAAGDNAIVELSTDSGATWNPLSTVTGQSINTWSRVQAPLGDYTGSARIRFRLQSDAGAPNADGWYVDDVSVSDLPTAVTLNAPVLQQPPTSVALSWTKNTDAFFKSYRIYRGTAAGVTLASTLVTTITDQNTTTFTDTNLNTGVTYFYRVFVFSAFDAHKGSNEESVTTTVPTPGGVVAYPFFDDVEAGVGNWNPAAPWGITDVAGAAHSGTHSWTDSPAGNYANNANTSLVMNIDLKTAKMPVLTFWQQYALENNADFGWIEISTDGTSWSTPIYFVTGSSSWRQERIDLTPYAVFPNVRIRFRLTSNGSGAADGWYIDDIRVEETATPVFSYPFADDMESPTTESNWLSSSWELGSPGHSGTYYWKSNPKDQAPETTANFLTLGGVLDLSTARHPLLTFWHKANLNWRSSLYVQVSTSKGTSDSYTNIYSVGYYNGWGWSFNQIDLSEYAGLTNVRLRFLMYNYGYWDSWWGIDDVTIMEAPADVTLATPTAVTRHGATLGWTQNQDTNFGRYEIRRDTSSNVTTSSPLVATINDQAVTTYNDTHAILEPGYFYYRVWVFSDKNARSYGSNTVQAIYPALTRNAYPFFDDMESGTGNWDWNAPWGQVEGVAHSGARSWHDSPVANYANNANTAIEFSVDLRTAQMPVLSFWHQYALQTNNDFGYVDISTDGTNWRTMFFVTGNSTWKEEKIDITEFALQDNVRIRFRLWSNDSGTADGWYIDDVSVAETTKTAFAYPFFDDMEDTAITESNWLSSSWEPKVPGHSGTYYWGSNPEGVTAPGTDSSLTLASTIDLTNAVHPQLTFWQRYNLNYQSSMYVQVSTSKGSKDSYGNVWSLGYYSGQGNWTFTQIDLTQFAGLKDVRVKFFMAARYYGDSYWNVDDVRIEEAPVDVVLNPATNVTRHNVDLSWSRNNDVDFLRYEIRRSTTSDVNLGSTLVATITDQNATAYTNVIVSPAFYYYRIYVFNNKGAHSLGSNIIQAVFPPPPKLAYPFFDDLEGGTGNFDWSAPWGQTQAAAHSGGFSFTDSPVGNYGNNVDTSLEMRIDLRTAKMPVLSFWQQYALETNADFGFVAVSIDGTNWETIYFVTGTSSWREERIDLTEYALLEDVRIRFRLWSNDSNTADGWYVDDIRIAESTVPVLAYPFFDDMEATAASETNWLSSSWELRAPGHSGTYYWASNPNGITQPLTYDKLTLAGTFDLRQAVHPQLTFWQRYNVNYRSALYVQVSTSYGGKDSWSNVWSLGWYNGQGSWGMTQIDLTNYAGLDNVRLRFLIRAEYYNDSWWAIDDVRLGEAPADVTLNKPASVTRHSADLSWTRNTDTDFARYEIRRATTSDVNLGSMLVASITDQAQTAYTDTYAILDPGYYFYRIYVFNDKGVHSLGSGVEQAVYAPPPKRAYPFFDDMEAGTASWDYGAPWALTRSVARSGSYSWTDSPVGNYANNANTALTTSVDLRTARMPVLSFWHQSALQENNDWGLVEVSIDGNSWSTIFFATGSRSWEEVRIDLTEYAQFDNVRIRFRLSSNDSGTGDGWYIDDVRIAESPTPSLGYPFFDDMEDVARSQANWLSSSWALKSPGKSGTYFWASYPNGMSLPGTYEKLTLAGTVNLSGAVKPQLTFWQRYNINYSTHLYVQISTSRGTSESYTNLFHQQWYNNRSSWEQMTIDLTPYVGLTDVRIRFFFYPGTYSDSWWAIDDVRIDEVDTTAPATIGDLAVSAPTSSSLKLTWTAPGDDVNKGRPWQYDVRYATAAITAANWDAATKATGEPAPQVAGSLESFVVTGLNAFTEYFFAVKAADEVPNWSGLSNVASGTTFQAGVVLLKIDAPKEVLADRDFSAVVRIDEVRNFDAASYTITYDAAVMQLTGITAGEIAGVAVPVGGPGEGYNDTGGVVAITQNIGGVTGVSGAGTLAILTFHVLPDTKDATSNITPSNGVLSDVVSNPIQSYWMPDKVTVVDVLSGDANGDEKVNAVDITKVERIVIGLDPATAGADANHDGDINALDITKVERIILGLD